ncbi:MAG: aminotransferase class IV [Bacteroidales bacterium]
MGEKERIAILDHHAVPESQINRQALAKYDMFYEVVRVVDGKVVFLNDHLSRMQNSLSMAGVKKRISRAALQKDIRMCIGQNHLREGNLRFSAFYDGKLLKWLHEVVPHHYPSAENYRDGVAVAVVLFERERPNIKKWNQSMKDVVSRYKAIKQVYEVLLYDRQGFLTEGSKSNLFFVVGRKVVTAPENMVLKGITRKYVIQVIKELGLELEEKAVHVTDVLKYDAVFITGTSPKVLPVNEIKACCHADVRHPVLRDIMAGYDELMQDNLN